MIFKKIYSSEFYLKHQTGIRVSLEILQFAATLIIGIRVASGYIWDLENCGLFIIAIIALWDSAYANKIKDDLKKKDETIAVLKKEIKRQKVALSQFREFIDDMIMGHLAAAANQLNFEKEEEKLDRITVFVLANNSFFALARFSLNPDYQNIDTEKNYDCHKGAISKGYANGWHYIGGDDRKDHRNNMGAYTKWLKNSYGYSKEEVEDMTMKSLCYAVKRMNKREKCLGVIVLESITPQRFTEDEAKVVLEQLSKNIDPILKTIKFDSKTATVLREVQVDKGKASYTLAD